MSATSGKLWLIVGSGHCGTLWLSKVLAEVPGMRSYHELRHDMAGMPWPNSVGYTSDLAAQMRYWDLARGHMVTSTFCDSNSWAPYEIPLVNSIQKIDRIIYLVRNGIQQIHSLHEKSHVWQSHPIESYAYDVWLRSWWRVLHPGEPEHNFSKLSRWERLCTLIEANLGMPHWLQRQGFPVDVYRLEDLTTEPWELAEVAKLPMERLEKWQKRDINRKVEGRRDPGYIWGTWDRSTRLAYNRICSATMKAYGYREWE